MLDPLKMPAHFSEQLYARQVRLVDLPPIYAILRQIDDRSMTLQHQGKLS